jgi:hypothetical protein
MNDVEFFLEVLCCVLQMLHSGLMSTFKAEKKNNKIMKTSLLRTLSQAVL